MKSFRFSLMTALGAVISTAAFGEVIDRPQGIKIGQRMTLVPYVTLSVSYDSNVEARHGSTGAEEGDVLWTVSPGLGLTYNAENWSLLLSGYYNYKSYTKDEYRNYNGHSFGQDLRWNWSNSKGGEKGWSLILGESFRQYVMSDEMTLDGGQNYSGDSRQLQVSGVLQRRFNEKWHADINADYYWLDYLNDSKNRYTYYGWDRWSVGAEAGFAPSKWTDILVCGSYMGYTQDNVNKALYDNSSKAVSVQAGLGSYMTERISYRVLGGWSQFRYSSFDEPANGFVYTVSGNWKIGESWNTMLLASSYYQPSERQYSTQTRVDAVSWGVAKLLIRGRLRTTLDLRYRHEDNEYVGAGNVNGDYALDIVTARLGASYYINRIFSIFANIEYQRSFNEKADDKNGAYDYDRWRATVGVKLSY